MGSSDMSARAVEVGELTVAPRECSLDKGDRITRDIAEPRSGFFEGMVDDFVCLSDRHERARKEMPESDD